MVAHQPLQQLEYIKSDILNDREKKFISEYLIHGNATQAILEAGYKTKAPSRYANISKNSGKKEGEKYEYVNGYI